MAEVTYPKGSAQGEHETQLGKARKMVDVESSQKPNKNVYTILHSFA